ncbi:hypothetical protein FRC03_009208 [Tulasnella sp. 419]|nr:hypothetical protein FRC03_009208 [Tulasnella sp. 419]
MHSISTVSWLLFGAFIANTAAIPISEAQNRAIKIHSDNGQTHKNDPIDHPKRPVNEKPDTSGAKVWTEARVKTPPPAHLLLLSEEDEEESKNHNMSSQYLQRRDIDLLSGLRGPSGSGVKKMSEEGSYRVGFRGIPISP